MCVCSLSYPAFKGHAPPHIFICGLSGSIIIFQIISSTLRFFREKNVIEYTRRVFWFFLQLLLETFLILRTTQRDIVTHTHIFTQSTHYSCLILIKLEFSRRIFEKAQISNFMKILPMGEELFHADEQTWGNFSKFCERALTNNILGRFRPYKPGNSFQSCRT